MAYLIYGPGLGFRGKYGAAVPSYDESVGRPPFVNGPQFIRKTEATYFTPMPVGGEGKRDAFFSITEAIDTLAGTGTVVVSATLNTTEIADIAALTAEAILSSSFAITEQIDLLAFTANTIVSAIIQTTEPTDILAFTATAGVARNAVIGATEPTDNCALTVRASRSYYSTRLWQLYPKLQEQLFQDRDIDIDIEESRDRCRVTVSIRARSQFATSEAPDRMELEINGYHDLRYFENEMTLLLMAA
jgi:hypothetical protein